MHKHRLKHMFRRIISAIILTAFFASFFPASAALALRQETTQAAGTASSISDMLGEANGVGEVNITVENAELALENGYTAEDIELIRNTWQNQLERIRNLLGDSAFKCLPTVIKYKDLGDRDGGGASIGGGEALYIDPKALKRDKIKSVFSCFVIYHELGHALIFSDEVFKEGLSDDVKKSVGTDRYLSTRKKRYLLLSSMETRGFKSQFFRGIEAATLSGEASSFFYLGDYTSDYYEVSDMIIEIIADRMGYLLAEDKGKFREWAGYDLRKLIKFFKEGHYEPGKPGHSYICYYAALAEGLLSDAVLLKEAMEEFPKDSQTRQHYEELKTILVDLCKSIDIIPVAIAAKGAGKNDEKWNGVSVEEIIGYDTPKLSRASQSTSYRNYLLNYIRDKFGASLRIISIGAGRGDLEKALIGQGHNVVAVELKSDYATECRLKGIRTIVADGKNFVSLLEPDEKFDLVLFSESIGSIGLSAIPEVSMVLVSGSHTLVTEYPYKTDNEEKWVRGHLPVNRLKPDDMRSALDKYHYVDINIEITESFADDDNSYKGAMVIVSGTFAAAKGADAASAGARGDITTNSVEFVEGDPFIKWVKQDEHISPDEELPLRLLMLYLKFPSEKNIFSRELVNKISEFPDEPDEFDLKALNKYSDDTFKFLKELDNEFLKEVSDNVIKGYPFYIYERGPRGKRKLCFGVHDMKKTVSALAISSVVNAAGASAEVKRPVVIITDNPDSGARVSEELLKLDGNFDTSVKLVSTDINLQDLRMIIEEYQILNYRIVVKTDSRKLENRIRYIINGFKAKACYIRSDKPNIWRQRLSQM